MFLLLSCFFLLLPKHVQTTRQVLLVLIVIAIGARRDGLDVIAVHGGGRGLPGGGGLPAGAALPLTLRAAGQGQHILGRQGCQGGEELEERKAASSSCFYRDLAKWAMATARRRSDVGEQGRKSRAKKQEETSQSF